jgi:CRISPR-associated endonuclease/helicase Cas3
VQGKPTGFWAKLDEDDDGEVTAWHPLAAHSLDVAATLRELLEQTSLGARLGRLAFDEPLTDVQIARLAALAALHDAGKVNHGFQNRWSDDITGPRGGHVAPIVHIFKACAQDQNLLLADALRMQPIMGWFDEPATLEYMFRATFAHHGRPVRPQPRFERRLWEADDRRDPLAELADLRDRIEEWFPAAFEGDAPPFPNAPRFQHAYNGVLTLADWLGSDSDHFAFQDDGEDRAETAPEIARNLCRKRGFDPDPAREALGDEAPDFDDFADFDSPHDIQRTCRELPVHETGGLTILESDTGSGKTEAAIARFLRLYHAGRVDGMYFALPTRSAATELHGRVTEAMKRVFPDDATRPPVVQAVPGYIRVDDEEAIRLPDFDVQWNDDPASETRARRWAAEQSKRYLAGSVVVGTIDQVYLSTLKVSHTHLRGAALLRHLLVVDEVHASDAYMTRLLESVLDNHLAAGGHAFLMSATLGSSARSRYATGDRTDAPALEEARETDYPLVTHVSAHRESPEQVHAASSDYSKTVEVSTAPVADNPEAIASRAVEAARDGARVLVIRNLVDECRATQTAVERVGDQDLLFGIDDTPAPHHSRFAPDDRERLDDEIEAAFGEEADREGGLMCVATQTVEQSLDIDADLLITDLAPVDILLQRIGRLHRHPDRDRPAGYQRAETQVLVPEQRDLGEWVTSTGRVSGEHGLGSVYPDLRLLEVCWRLVDEHDTWQIPEMNRELVERGTHPERLRRIAEDGGDAWENHEQQLLGARTADRHKGEKWIVDWTEPFAEEAFGHEELDEYAKTRLGGDDFQVDFEDPPRGPFGQPVEQLSLPDWMIGEEAADEIDDEATAENVRPTDEGFTFDFAGKTFSYSRTGIHRNGATPSSA